MTAFFNETEIKKIVSLAKKAGEIATSGFIKKDFTIKQKIDGSRVTSIDIEISEFLRQNLAKEFPQIPVICEEGKLREISEEIFFLIDPIDGTSSFIKGEVEFCINIALIKDKKAVFGLLYAPVFEGGKMAFSDEKNQIILNGEALKIKNNEGGEKLKIITSSRSKNHEVEEYLANNFKDFSGDFVIEKLASAVKFFRILEGDANLYLHFRPSMEWDTAAGQALTEILGISPIDLKNGKILTYKKPGFENSPFLLRRF